MSEEEKKAIEVMKTYMSELVYDKKYFEIILNLIEKQQKEIEELKELLEHKNEYTSKLEKDLFENCSNYVIPKSKIKEKIKKIKSDKYFDYVGNEWKDSDVVELLQELVESEE